MALDKKTLRLIAVGASIAANCQTCLQTSVSQAREVGVSERDIMEAVEIGKLVRRGAASWMDKVAPGLNDVVPGAESTIVGDCQCGS